MILLLTALVGFPVLGQEVLPGTGRETPSNAVKRQLHNADPLGELGRTLFFDARLSQDGTISCASCHQPDKAFADGKTVAEGIHGRKGTRNTPSLRTATYAKAQFWDGRRESLETQVLDPFIHPNEHGLRDHHALLGRLQDSTDYDPLFQSALGISAKRATPADVAKALSAYVQSLKQTGTRLERYLFAQEATALNPAERRGLDLFRGQAQCAHCHIIGEREAPLTDGKYHSLALGLDRLAPRLGPLTQTVAKTPREERDRLVSSDVDVAALGRFVVTLNPPDIGKFKTPSLRNVADTAPYMHDGSIATLEEALERELYYRGKALGHPLVLSIAERADLLAFLKALTDSPTGQ